MITLYWAGRLFNQAEMMWNKLCAEYLRSLGYRVILPQEEAEKFRNQDGTYDLDALAKDCARCSADSDVGVYNLDGSDVDSGTALEAGIKIATKSMTGRGLALGVRTDFRGMSEDPKTGVNAMFRLLDKIIRYTADADYRKVCDQIDEEIRRNLNVQVPG